MKNFKQVTFGILLSALVLGFSAFTNAKRLSTTNRYYNTTGVNDMNPSHYEFIDGGTSDCSTSTKQCSAEWTTSNAPSAGQTPTQAGSPSYAGSAEAGTFSGD